MLSFGIIGAGHIAEKLAYAMMKTEGINLYAVASRDIEKAGAFVEKFGGEKAYGSYEEMVSDKNIDAVYIATPNNFHFSHSAMALNAGKHVLCEKPVCVNAEEFRKVTEMAYKKSLFFGEAMWTRFLPMTVKLKELIDKKTVGRINMMTANLNFPMMHKQRLLDPKLAGGGLLDVGIYPLTMAGICMGYDIRKISADAILTDRGMDRTTQITLVYKDGIASLSCGISELSDGAVVLYGEEGYIKGYSSNALKKIEVYDKSYNMIAEYDSYDDDLDYGHQLLAMKKAIEMGRVDFEDFTWEENLKVMEIMDEVRDIIGVKYPFEGKG